MLILQAQREALQIGIATPKNVHYALTKLTQNAGFKDADSFWTDPEAEGLPQQGNPEQEQMVKEQMQKMSEEIQKLSQEKQKLEAEILKRDTDTSVKVYEIDTRSNTELKKVEMTNENKTDLASMQAITDAILQTQQQLETRIGEVAESEPDLTPVIAQIEDIQNTITNSVPVSIKQIRDENGKLIGGVRILADGTEQEIMIK
jgi:soluble cytochrome b562